MERPCAQPRRQPETRRGHSPEVAPARLPLNSLEPLGPAHMPDPARPPSARLRVFPPPGPNRLLVWVGLGFFKPLFGWRFVDGKEEKRTLYSALILAPGISHLFSHLSVFPSACSPNGAQRSWVGGRCGCQSHSTHAPPQGPRPGPRKAGAEERTAHSLTSSDLSSSLGLVLRKWKTVSQGVRSSSGLGGDAGGLGGRGWGALSLRPRPRQDGA